MSKPRRSDPFSELFGEFSDRLRGDRWQPDVDVFETEGEVVVRALRGRRRGQHHVGVAGGLVEVRVDADHEVQSGQRLVEPVAVGGGEDGVGGDGDDRPHRLALLGGGVDLLGERGERQLPLGLGVTAHP